MESARTIRIGPGRVIQVPNVPVRLNPEGQDPSKYVAGVARWSISPPIAGMMERLARARYEISEITDSSPDDWKELKEQASRLTEEPDPVIKGLDSPNDVLSSIAQSVYASSAIEGEAVYAKDATLAIVGHVDNREAEKEDYKERIR